MTEAVLTRAALRTAHPVRAALSASAGTRYGSAASAFEPLLDADGDPVTDADGEMVMVLSA